MAVASFLLTQQIKIYVVGLDCTEHALMFAKRIDNNE